MGRCRRRRLEARSRAASRSKGNGLWFPEGKLSGSGSASREGMCPSYPHRGRSCRQFGAATRPSEPPSVGRVVAERPCPASFALTVVHF